MLRCENSTYCVWLQLAASLSLHHNTTTGWLLMLHSGSVQSFHFKSHVCFISQSSPQETTNLMMSTCLPMCLSIYPVCRLQAFKLQLLQGREVFGSSGRWIMTREDTFIHTRNQEWLHLKKKNKWYKDVSLIWDVNINYRNQVCK